MMALPRFGRRRKDGAARTPPVMDMSNDPDAFANPEPDPRTHPLPPQIGYVKAVHTVMAINRGLLGAVLALTVAVAVLSFSVLQSRKWVPVYVPPDTSQGVFLEAHRPGAATVYGFAAQTLQSLYHWPIDGQQDYRANIDSLALYLTPRFRTFLLTDLAQLSARFGINELRGRSRALHPQSGSLFEPERVRGIGDGVWEAELEFRLVEEVEGLTVKDIGIRYVLRVVQTDVNPAANQWGLMLDGFAADPVRVDAAREGGS